MKSAAVFMDRDGTLNEDTGYVRNPGDVRLIAGAGEAVQLLNEAGFKVVLVTNQPGVARGSMSVEDVEAVNARLCELLGEAGAHLDGVYYCPHLPDGTVAEFTRQCNCRKPKPGLLERAATEMELELTESFMVGDSPRDMQAGQAVGARTILIDRGASRNTRLDIVRTALEAAQRIIEITGRGTGAGGRTTETGRLKDEEKRETTPAAKEAAVAGVAGPEEEKAGQGDASASGQAADGLETQERRPEDIPVIRIHGVRVEAQAAEIPGPTAEEKAKAEEIPVITHGLAAAKEESEIIPAEAAPREVPVVRLEGRTEEAARETAREAAKEAPEEKRGKAAKEATGEEAKRGAEKRVEKTGTPGEPVNCAQCGSMIPEVDVETGRARAVEGKMLCRECHIYHLARTTHVREVGNAEILAELKNITRQMTYEPFSIFNIFGGLAQMGTFAALGYTLFTSDVSTGLMVAIVLQLMALTFFVLGKQ